MYGLVAFEAHHGKKSLLDTKSIWAETTEIYFGLERCGFMLWLRHFLAEATTGSAAWVSYFNLSPSLLFCKTGITPESQVLARGRCRAAVLAGGSGPAPDDDPSQSSVSVGLTNLPRKVLWM